MSLTTFYLIRHVQSHPKIDVEEAEWPITELGALQAKKLVEFLLPLDLDRVVSSPYLRCKETVRPFLEETELPATENDNLRERKLSDGLIPNFMETMNKSWDDFDFKLPGCESINDCTKRMRDTLLKLGQEHEGEAIGLSTHGHAISCLLHSIEDTFGMEGWKRIRNPDLFKLQLEGGLLLWDSDFQPEDGFAALASDPASTPIDAPWKK